MRQIGNAATGSGPMDPMKALTWAVFLSWQGARGEDGISSEGQELMPAEYHGIGNAWSAIAEAMARAYWDEGDCRPSAYLSWKRSDKSRGGRGDTVRFGWNGTWTRGRYVTIRFFESGPAWVEWSSGTGKPSSFLGMFLDDEEES